MKKVRIIIFLGALLFSFTANAQSNMNKPVEENENEKVEVPTGLKKGFRAILEAGFSTGTGNDREDRPVINASLGYQFNPYIYVGGGVGGAYFIDEEVFAIPIFANFRADFINNRISPFVDVKGGYSPADLKGGYASVSGGCRFNRFSVSMGYELFLEEDDDWGTTDYWGYFAKIGFEF